MYDGRIYPASTTSQLLKTAGQLDGVPSASQRGPRPTRVIRPSTHRELRDPVANAVVALADETVRSGYGALVFASSRAGSEYDARLISRVVPAFSESDPAVQAKRVDLLEELRSLSTGLDETLEQTIPCGVGFHRVLPSSPPLVLFMESHANWPC